MKKWILSFILTVGFGQIALLAQTGGCVPDPNYSTDSFFSPPPDTSMVPFSDPLLGIPQVACSGVPFSFTLTVNDSIDSEHFIGVPLDLEIQSVTINNIEGLAALGWTFQNNVICSEPGCEFSTQLNDEDPFTKPCITFFGQPPVVTEVTDFPLEFSIEAVAIIFGSPVPITANIPGDPNPPGQYIIRVLPEITSDCIDSYVVGEVFHNSNFDCGTTDPNTTPLEGWIVQFTKDGESRFGVSDESGNYWIKLDTGEYVVEVLPANELWEACPPSPAVVNVGNLGDTTFVDFQARAIAICPLMTADLSAALLRRCFDVNYYATVCNEGVIAENNAYATIELDPFITLNSASIPFSNLGNNLYQFVFGLLEPGDCVNFSLNVNVSCDAELGQTHCSTIHAYPDELCAPADPLWDNSSIEVSANCEGDSLRFFIENTGTGDMSEALQYDLIENQTILETNSFQLTAGNSTNFAVAANGNTWLLQAEQAPYHPGVSNPIVGIEGCVPTPGNPFQTGFLTQFPEDDGNPYLSTDCQENIGAYDPNDKQAFPVGYGPAHYIEKEVSLDYHIRFQNTGTDTAFNVVVRDTLSPHLDLTSIELGSYSHDYRLEIEDDNVMVFYFDNIMLPDSNVNEPASNGFFKFRINQKSDNEIGDIIYNSAAIYFDFNEPVITNEVFHEVGENFLETVVSITQLTEQAVPLYAQPNPFRTQTLLDLSGLDEKPDLFSIFNAQGKMVMERTVGQQESVLTIDGSSLSQGVYFFQLSRNGYRLGTGKVVVQ